MNNKQSVMLSDTIEYKNKITYLSLVLAIVVVIRHSVNIDVYGITSGWLYWVQVFLRELTDLAVPVFFAISGFLFYQNFNYSVLLSKWKKRFFSIVIPYFIWNVIAYLYYELIYNLPFISDNINQTIEPFSIVWLLKNMIFGYHNITWFLLNLIVYIAIGPAFYLILKNKYAGVVFLLVATVANMLYDNIYLKYGIVYFFGAYLGLNYKNIVKTSYKEIYIWLSLLFLGVTVCLGVFFPQVFLQRVYIITRLTQVVAIWIISDVLAVSKMPKWYMKISFFIYCAHSICLESIEKVFYIVLGNNTLGALIDLLFAPLLTVILLIAIAYLLRKIPPLWKVLTGGR